MPTADPNNIFGRVISRRAVEQAYVAHLIEWIPTCIYAMEEQEQLEHGTVPFPPDEQRSYRAGDDFNTWEPGWSPCYIVIVDPVDTPQRADGAGTYIQTFEVQIGVNVQITNEYESLGIYEEDSARQYADILGMAGAMAIIQHGGIGTWPDGTSVADRTDLLRFPVVSHPLPSERSVARSTFTVVSYVSSVLTGAAGPTEPFTFPGTPTIGDVPDVEDISIEIVGVSPDGSVSGSN